MAYTYEKQLWKDYPDTSTPITADRLNHMEDGIAEAAKNGGGESDKVGVVKMFSGSTAPEGWLICDGSAVSRTTYSELFSIIGTTYGKGDGSTTFNIPNIKGRTVVGLNSSDTTFNTLGKTGGEKTHKLTVNEMPSHKHNVSFSTQLGNAEQRLALGSNSGGTTGTTGVYGTPTVDAGGNQPHNNLQPYIVLNYIIKASTTTPVQGEIIDSLEGDSTTNAPSVHAINSVLRNNIITNGNPVKTGRIIDGKDEYIQRFSFTGLNATAQTYSKTLGFIANNSIIIGFEGASKSNSNNWFYFTDSSSTAAWGLYFMLNSSDNTIKLTTLNSNMLEAYINVKYISKV